MSHLDPSTPLVLLLLAVLAPGVYGLRLSFIHLRGVVAELPPRAEQALSFVPAAVLAALVTPELFVLDGSPVGVVLDVRVLAGGVGTVVAWRTGSMIATILAGMAVLWTGLFLVPG